MKIRIGLIGNQNSGKTTLFNQLTGSNQHVGNFPGVTVEGKTGFIKPGFFKGEEFSGLSIEAELVDLPGIYSLSPYTSEEIVTRDFLTAGHPDAVINILDATNIERNLYLTLQLMEMQIPMVVALNMMDEVRNAGNSIDVQALEKELGIDVVPISASKGEGVSELAQRAAVAATRRKKPGNLDFCEGPVHQAIHSIAHLIDDHAAAAGLPLRFAATKLVEGDKPVLDRLRLNENEQDILGHIVNEMESALDTDREAALADMRYAYIARITKDTVHRHSRTKEQIRSVKIDNILTHRIFAIPIFLGIMALIFYLTFGLVGAALSDWFSMGIDWITGAVDRALYAYGLNPLVHSLIINGIFAGVGSVLSFMPTILVLFFFLAILEDSGYMARVAFVMDTLLRHIGLSGKSFVPMLIGFGCSVPAIMATRTLSSRRDKKLTVFILPFMSCSAKLPVYALFTSTFFPENAAAVMIMLYIGGMIVAVLAALLLRNTIFRGKPVPFVLELPAYRLPSFASMALNIGEKARDFLTRAFTIICAASIVIWFLTTLDVRLNVVSSPDKSMLASVGSFLAPVFKPLGFGDWRISTALITGLTAKEAVVSTLAVLLGTGTGLDLQSALGYFLSPSAALALLVFVLLYMPCVAAMAVTRREIGRRNAVAAMMFQTATAWVAAYTVYNLACALGL